MRTTISGMGGQDRGFTALSRITLHRYLRSTTHLGDERVIVDTYRNDVHVVALYKYVRTIEGRINDLRNYVYELVESKSEGLDQAYILENRDRE